MENFPTGYLLYRSQSRDQLLYNQLAHGLKFNWSLLSWQHFNPPMASLRPLSHRVWSGLPIRFSGGPEETVQSPLWVVRWNCLHPATSKPIWQKQMEGDPFPSVWSDQIVGQSDVNGQPVLYIQLPIEQSSLFPCPLCISGADTHLSSACSAGIWHITHQQACVKGA